MTDKFEILVERYHDRSCEVARVVIFEFPYANESDENIRDCRQVYAIYEVDLVDGKTKIDLTYITDPLGDNWSLSERHAEVDFGRATRFGSRVNKILKSLAE